MNILVIKLGAAGDIIRTTAVLPGLKAKYPRSRIDWVTNTSYSSLLIGNPYIHKVFHIEESQKFNGNSYDMVINFDEEYSACQLASAIPHDYLVGAYLHGKTPSYTPNSADWFDAGLISRHGLRKANVLKRKNEKTYQELWYKILNIPYKKQEPHLSIPKAGRYFAEKFAAKYGINSKTLVIGFNPGSSKRWWDKRMSVGDTVKLGWEIHDRYPNAKIVLLGGPEEADRNILIKKRLPFLIDSGIKNTLGQFAAIINLCKVVITSDSLAMHTAIALKKKVVVFFAPTSHREIETYGRGHKVLPIRGCIGCYRKECRIKPIYDIDAMAKLI